MGLARSLFSPLTSKLIPWREYYQRVLNTRPDARVGYWPLWEPSGNTDYDLGGNGFNGAGTGVILNQRGMGDGRTAASFNGSTSRINLYSAAFAAKASVTELTLLIWLQRTAAQWSSTTVRQCVSIGADTGSNVFRLRLPGIASQLMISYVAGGTAKTVTLSPFAPTNFFCIGMTVSKIANQMKAYLNGVQTGATQTALGVWSGALAATLCVIGAQSTTPAQLYTGLAAHCALWNAPLTADAMAYLGRYDPGQGA